MLRLPRLSLWLELAGSGAVVPAPVPTPALGDQVSRQRRGQPGPQGVTVQERDDFMPPPAPFHNPAALGRGELCVKPGAIRCAHTPVFSCRIFPGHE